MVDGGSGNDTLLPGAGAVAGTTDADTLIGGAGIDRVDDEARAASLLVSLDGAQNDGAPGEGDNVLASVEAVTSGSGDDTITGTAAPETFDGGEGDDVLSGLGGADTLVGSGGDADLLGGADPDRAHGGEGEDYLEGGTGADTMLGGGASDTLATRDSAKDAVASCGARTDFAISDARDKLTSCDRFDDNTADRPVLGSKAALRPVQGDLDMRLPGTGRFVPLRDQADVPIGVRVDAGSGSKDKDLRVTMAGGAGASTSKRRKRKTRRDRAVFSGGASAWSSVARAGRSPMSGCWAATSLCVQSPEDGTRRRHRCGETSGQDPQAARAGQGSLPHRRPLQRDNRTRHDLAGRGPVRRHFDKRAQRRRGGARSREATERCGAQRRELPRAGQVSGARRWAGFLRRKREQDFTTHLRGNVVAYLALFVALGGTSYAAATLPRNSVTAKQIAARAVGSAELKNGAVTSQKVRGLRLEDFKPGELAKLTVAPVAEKAKGGAKGSPGPQGPEGAIGPLGPVGPAGPAVANGDRSVVYKTRTETVPAQTGNDQDGFDFEPVVVLCPDDPGGQRRPVRNRKRGNRQERDAPRSSCRRPRCRTPTPISSRS